MDLTNLIKKYSDSKSSKHVYLCCFESPVGKLICAADDNHVLFVAFEDSKNFEKIFKTLSKEIPCNFYKKKNDVLINLEDQLEKYFAGKLENFSIPIKTFGSDFQKEVWKGLQELPYGSTQTYGDLAKTLGRASSHSRAVGAACGANAHILVIPCHRLVASGGKRGGFSCGIDRKEWLLQHEQKHGT